MMSLSLNLTYQRNRVSLLVKFGLKKIIVILKKNDNDVTSSRKVNKKSNVSIIYIYIYIDDKIDHLSYELVRFIGAIQLTIKLHFSTTKQSKHLTRRSHCQLTHRCRHWGMEHDPHQTDFSPCEYRDHPQHPTQPTSAHGSFSLGLHT